MSLSDQEANAVTCTTLEVIEYLQPKWYAIENPYSSLVWKQPIFDHLPTKTVSYCMHSCWGYRKNTTICTNIPFDHNFCKEDCGYVREQGKKHKCNESFAKHGVSAHCKALGVQCTTHRRDELYRVPGKLVRDILEAYEDEEEDNVGVLDFQQDNPTRRVGLKLGQLQ